MNPTVLVLSIASMVSLGVAWFLAARVSKQLSPLVSTLLFQAVGIPFFFFLYPFNPVPFSHVNFIGLSAVGVYETFVMFAVFRAMREGDVSVVVPIIDSFAIVTFILGIVFLHESVSLLKVISMIGVIVGIVLLSLNVANFKNVSLKKGVFWALIGSVGAGIYFYWVTILTRGSGWFYTAFIIRLAIAVTSAIFVGLQRAKTGLNPGNIPWIWLAAGAGLDVIGFSLYNAAVSIAETSKVTVITSSSTLIIVLLGVIVLKERLSRIQIVGAFVIVCGLIFLQL